MASCVPFVLAPWSTAPFLDPCGDAHYAIAPCDSIGAITAAGTGQSGSIARPSGRHANEASCRIRVARIKPLVGMSFGRQGRGTPPAPQPPFLRQRHQRGQ